MHITIDMPWERDLSVNSSHFGPGGHYRRKGHVQAWMRSLAWRIKAEIIGMLWAPPIKIMVEFRWPDARMRDDHNYYKVICDAVADGLGINDSNIRIGTINTWIVKANPGFTIRIEDGEENNVS